MLLTQTESIELQARYDTALAELLNSVYQCGQIDGALQVIKQQKVEVEDATIKT